MSRIVHNNTLVEHLKSDIKLLGLPTDFGIVLKDISESYFGRYIVKDKTIILYLTTDKGTRTYTYSELLKTTLHEAIHHYQHHHDNSFIRYRGVMHNSVFRELELNSLNTLARLEVIDNAKIVSS